MKCALCQTKESTGRHHLIPKYVIKKINPNAQLRHLVIYLCDACHREMHYAFINHIIMVANRGVDWNRYDALRYHSCLAFIKQKGLYKEWRAYWLDFINSAIKDFEEDDSDMVEIKEAPK